MVKLIRWKIKRLTFWYFFFFVETRIVSIHVVSLIRRRPWINSEPRMASISIIGMLYSWSAPENLEFDNWSFERL